MVVGRVANRIAQGKFTMKEVEYSCSINNGPNSLHGGVSGFDKKDWTCVPTKNGVKFSLKSPDGDGEKFYSRPSGCMRLSGFDQEH